jgi:exosortase
MTPAVEHTQRLRLPWPKLAIFAALILLCYAPILLRLGNQWMNDADMGHGFFVPVVAGYIVWRKRDELRAIKPQPNAWGLLIVAWGALQMMVGVLGSELFTSRTAFVVTLIGAVFTLGGSPFLCTLMFPLLLLFLMIPIPTVIYNEITFPLQILASQLAAGALGLIGIPVLREGNILEVPNGHLSVVEACSGIRSLLSLTFLSLVYGYFFEPKTWIRATLFLATIPVAILANGSRVTVTGILYEVRPDLAEGFFHESTGLVIFFVAAVILFALHQILIRCSRMFASRS